MALSPNYAFGSPWSHQESAPVPLDSTVHYEVELVSFVKAKEITDMSNEEKIEAARRNKKKGKTLFKAFEFARASKRFDKVLELRLKDF